MTLIDIASYRDKKNSETNTPVFEKPPLITELSKTLITSNLEMDDSVFDSLLPEFYQYASQIHWTPIEAINQIAEFISECDENTKFLDIGSGCGKLCILLSLITKINIYGIEQRRTLYKCSQKIKLTYKLENVHFIHGNMLDIDWSDFDIYYLYNPFQEHISNFGGMRIDHTIEFDKKHYIMYTSEVFRQL